MNFICYHTFEIFVSIERDLKYCPGFWICLYECCVCHLLASLVAPLNAKAISFQDPEKKWKNLTFTMTDISFQVNRLLTTNLWQRLTFITSPDKIFSDLRENTFPAAHQNTPLWDLWEIQTNRILQIQTFAL